MLQGTVSSAVKKTVQAEHQASLSEKRVLDIKIKIQQNMKKRATLEVMAKAIFEKNHKLYLEHEVMLDEERVKRAKLAEEFQQKMGVI